VGTGRCLTQAEETATLPPDIDADTPMATGLRTTLLTNTGETAPNKPAEPKAAPAFGDTLTGALQSCLTTCQLQVRQDRGSPSGWCKTIASFKLP
jgi:hypothetical protein